MKTPTARQLRAFRKKMGWTQHVAAMTFGYADGNSWARLERGVRHIPRWVTVRYHEIRRRYPHLF